MLSTRATGSRTKIPRPGRRTKRTPGSVYARPALLSALTGADESLHAGFDPSPGQFLFEHGQDAGVLILVFELPTTIFD